MRRTYAVLALALGLALAAWPAAARGAEATAAEVRALAEAAQRDAGALDRLRAIDVVDGRPAQLDDALSGVGAEVRARLRALAQSPSEGGAGGVRPAASAAREQARDVLAERRFQRTNVPSPLRDVRERIGEGMRSLGRPLESAFNRVAGWIPGGRPVLWVLLATLVLAAAAFFAGRTENRRAGAEAGAAAGIEGRESAARLRKDAEQAERRGDLEEALRLQFRAGLVDLDERGLIELRPALTNRELLGAVPSPTLGELVDGFEAVAYGGRPADAEDVRGARDGWPRVPEEAERR